MDIVVKTTQMPSDGQTLTGKEFFTNPGGKGANQAVAAARLGVTVLMVGRVGNDTFGRELLSSLRSNNVDVDGVLVDENNNSGTAMIMVADNGENRIVVIPGANGQLCDEDVVRLDKLLNGVSVLLLQLEVPIESVMLAANKAHAHGVMVILDPAPFRTLSKEIYSVVDIITPNQNEAEALVGFPVRNKNDAKKAAKELLGRGVKHVIIKMGSRGAYWTDGRSEQYLPALKVEVVDTVAAGDAFNGSLGAALAEGKTIDEALQMSLAVGALSVTKKGAQQSMPFKKELLEFMASF